MVNKKTWFALLGLLALLLAAMPAVAEQAVGVKASEGITLKDWSHSSPNEKYAFLLGMATMVEIEKYWRANHDASLIDKWSLGFADPTFKQIVDKIDGYALTHPGEESKQLVEVLWFEMVAPKLTEAK